MSLICKPITLKNMENVIYSIISPQSAINTRLHINHSILFYFNGIPEEVPAASIAYTTSIPSTTRPNTTCFPSNHGVFTYIIKWNNEYSRNEKLGIVCIGTCIRHR